MSMMLDPERRPRSTVREIELCDHIDRASDMASKASFLSAIALTLYRVTRIAFFQGIFLGTIAFIVTFVIKKVFEDCGCIRPLERWALDIDKPFVKLALIAVTNLFFEGVPVIFIGLSLGVGILQGLTHDVYVQEIAIRG